MMAQQLALQSPCGHMCLRPASCRVSHRVSPLSRASVSSAAANIVNRHVRPTSSYKAIDSLKTAVVPVAGAAAAESNKFFEMYVLGKHIGSGAYGQVQLVIERATGQCAAVKLLPKIRGKLSKEKTMKKIRKEVELMASIQDCGNVIGLHGVYEDDAQVYVVMELCSGGDLERILEERGSFSELQTALVLYECLKVIATCHAKSVVHGDVKPANFMLKQRFRDPLNALERGAAEGDWLKAVDFGCSQSYRNKSSLSRRTGTPVYMAPEVFKRDYLEASDMWSLGMMMYQLLTGRFPFWDTLEQCRSHGIDEVMRATIMDPIPINYGPWLSMSEEGLSFIKSLLLRNPDERLSAGKALEHPWFTRQFGDAGLSPSPSCNRSQQDTQQASPSTAPSTVVDVKDAQRNNIVPLPQHQQEQQQQQQQQHVQQQAQQQHQHLQSHHSLPSKPHVFSM